MINNPRYLKEIYDRNIDDLLKLCTDYNISQIDIVNSIYLTFFRLVKKDLVFSSLEKENEFLKSYLKNIIIKKKKYKLIEYDDNLKDVIWLKIREEAFFKVDKYNNMKNIFNPIIVVIIISFICFFTNYLLIKSLHLESYSKKNNVVVPKEVKEEKKEYEFISSSLIDDTLIINIKVPSLYKFNDAILNYNISPIYLNSTIENSDSLSLIFFNVGYQDEYDIKIYSNDFNEVSSYKFSLGEDKREFISEDEVIDESLEVNKLVVLDNYVFVKGPKVDITNIKLFKSDGLTIDLDVNKYLSSVDNVQILYYSSKELFKASDIDRIMINDVYEY